MWVLGHFGTSDDFIPVEDAKKLVTGGTIGIDHHPADGVEHALSHGSRPSTDAGAVSAPTATR